MNLIPDVSPKTFSLSAIIVGYLLLDDLTANEQNALGNWLMLTAQVLCTNGFYKQVQAERQGNKIKSEKENSVVMLQKMVNALNKEIDELKSKY